MLKRRETLIAVFWVLLGITISLWSSTFPLGGLKDVGPKLFPLATGLVLTVLGMIRFFQSARGQEDLTPAHGPSPAHHRAAAMRVFYCLLGMTLSAALLEPLGFLLTVFLMILFMMRAIEPRKWGVALSFSLISAVVAFVVFKVLLKTALPRGLLGF